MVPVVAGDNAQPMHFVRPWAGKNASPMAMIGYIDRKPRAGDTAALWLGICEPSAEHKAVASASFAR